MTIKDFNFHFYLSPNRGLFIIDDKGILRQITMNDIPVSIHVVWTRFCYLFTTGNIHNRWADRWMRRYGWFKLSSTQTRREKVSEMMADSCQLSLRYSVVLV